MNHLFSPSRLSFFIRGVNTPGLIPDDVIAIDENTRHQVTSQITQDHVLAADLDGRPIAVLKNRTIEEAIAVVKDRLSRKFVQLQSKVRTFGAYESDLKDQTIASLITALQSAELTEEETVIWKYSSNVYQDSLPNFKTHVVTVVKAKRELSKQLNDRVAYVEAMTNPITVIKYDYSDWN